MANAIIRDSMVGITMGQCLVLCRGSPKGVSECVIYLVNGNIIAVKEFGEGICIGCSMDLVSSMIRDETCIGWFVFVIHSKGNAVK